MEIEKDIEATENPAEADGQDTKTRIFMTSLRMFASEGFENVPIRTIAKAVGIKAASIYNHYASKEQILDACYDYFLEHRYITRLTKEQYIPVLQRGTRNDIFDALSYSFREDIMEPMLMSVLIIFSRIYCDSKARDVFADDLNSSMDYMKEFFETGIELGRFNQFDIRAVSLIILSTRVFIGQSVSLSPMQQGHWHNAQGTMFKELSNLIPFRY